MPAVLSTLTFFSKFDTAKNRLYCWDVTLLFDDNTFFIPKTREEGGFLEHCQFVLKLCIFQKLLLLILCFVDEIGIVLFLQTILS